MNFVGWLSKKSVLLPSLLPSPWQQGDTAGMLTTSSHQDWQKDGTTRSSCKSWKTATWRTSTVFPEMSQCRKWDTHWETLTLKLAMRCDVVLLWPSQVLDGWLQRCEQREELPSFSRNVRALGKTRKALHYIYYISVRNLQLIRVHIHKKEMSVFEKVVNYFSSFSAVFRGRYLYQPHREKQTGKLDCDFSLKELCLIGNCFGVAFCCYSWNKSISAQLCC